MTGGETGRLAESSDLDLIRGWREGDHRAATALVERHALALARFVGRYASPEDVEEVVQESLARAFESISQFRGESSFRTWLFAIARRQVLDRHRASRRREAMVPIEEGHAITSHDTLDSLIASETGHRIRDAMRRLTMTQREVFSLRAGEGLSYQEIAEVVGTTEGSARVHYYNALRTIKELLDDRMP
jgi:RNA polymerase sigma-70 factor, ECF subfamily